MEDFEVGKEANAIVDQLKEKTHDYQATRNVLMAALRILGGRIYTDEGGWSGKSGS